MSNHPFRVFSERGARSTNPEEVAALFAPEVTLHSPILTKAVSGRERILQILANAFAVVGSLQYTLEVSANQQTVFLWKGEINGYELQAATVLVEDANGLIDDITILMRPYPVVTLFRQAMRELSASSLPEDFWELAPQ